MLNQRRETGGLVWDDGCRMLDVGCWMWDGFWICKNNNEPGL